MDFNIGTSVQYSFIICCVRINVIMFSSCAAEVARVRPHPSTSTSTSLLLVAPVLIPSLVPIVAVEVSFPIVVSTIRIDELALLVITGVELYLRHQCASRIRNGRSRINSRSRNSSACGLLNRLINSGVLLEMRAPVC